MFLVIFNVGITMKMLGILSVVEFISFLLVVCGLYLSLSKKRQINKQTATTITIETFTSEVVMLLAFVVVIVFPLLLLLLLLVIL